MRPQKLSLWFLDGIIRPAILAFLSSFNEKRYLIEINYKMIFDHLSLKYQLLIVPYRRG